MAKKPPDKRGGWFELPDASGKAPIHKAVANKKNTIGLLRMPMVKRKSKWTDETIINELKKIRSDLGHFPTYAELSAMGRGDLCHAISKHGGMNKFRHLLKEEIIQVDTGFWSDKTIINELKKIRSDLGHFPTQTEIRAMDRSGLSSQIFTSPLGCRGSGSPVLIVRGGSVPHHPKTISPLTTIINI